MLKDKWGLARPQERGSSLSKVGRQTNLWEERKAVQDGQAKERVGVGGEKNQEAKPGPEKPSCHSEADGLEMKGCGIHRVTVTFIF